MKKIWLLFMSLLIIAGFSGGCQPPDDQFEEADLVIVDQYFKEAITAMQNLLPDLKGWIRDYYEDDYPYQYDRERLEWLNEHLAELEKIQELRRSELFPSRKEIADWQLIVIRNDSESLLEGKELNDTLQLLDRTLGQLVGLMKLIVSQDGELSEMQSEMVDQQIEQIPATIETVREVFFR